MSESRVSMLCNTVDMIGQHLHRGDRGDRAGVSRERGEGGVGARLLDVCHTKTGREVRLRGRRRRLLDDVGAVDEVALVVAEEGHFAESSGERGLELRLVVCRRIVVSARRQAHNCGVTEILTDEGLPLASSASVASKLGVGLKTDLTPERGLDLTLVSGGSGEERTAELGLDEKLGVEEVGSGVEGSPGDRLVDMVGSSDRVAGGLKSESD